MLKRKTQRTAFGLVLAAHIAFGVGCGDGSLSRTGDGEVDSMPKGPRVTITKPSPGEIVKERLIKVEGTVPSGDSVRVNGTPVPVRSGSFSQTISATGDGPLQIRAEADGLSSATVDIGVDLLPPTIGVSMPMRGAFASVNARAVRVQGQVTDTVSPIRKLSVNGIEAQLGVGGVFSVDVTPPVGMNVLILEAEDTAGRKSDRRQGVIFGAFEPWNALTEVADVRLRADVIDQLADELLGGLGSDQLTDLSGLFGDATDPNAPDIRVSNLVYSNLTVELMPAMGYLAVAIGADNVSADVDGTLDLGFGAEPISGNVRATRLDVDLDLEFYVDPEAKLGGRVVRPRLRAANMVITLDDPLLQPLVDLLGDSIPGLLEGLLDGQDLGVLADATSLIQESGVLGDSGMNVRAGFRRFDVDPMGIAVGFVGNVEAPLVGVAESAPGLLVTEGPPPSASGEERMIRASIPDELLNQLAFKLWGNGLLDLDVGSLLAGGGGLPGGLAVDARTLSLLLGDEILEHASADTPVSIKLRPLLPPVASFASPTKLGLALADAMIDVALEPAGSAPIPVLSLALDVKVEAEVGFENGELILTPSATLGTDVDSEPLFDLDDEAIEGVLEGLLAGAIPDLLSGDGIGSIAGDLDVSGLIPGIVFSNTSLSVDGAKSDYLSLRFDVSTAP